MIISLSPLHVRSNNVFYRWHPTFCRENEWGKKGLVAYLVRSDPSEQGVGGTQGRQNRGQVGGTRSPPDLSGIDAKPCPWKGLRLIILPPPPLKIFRPPTALSAGVRPRSVDWLWMQHVILNSFYTSRLGTVYSWNYKYLSQNMLHYSEG